MEYSLLEEAFPKLEKEKDKKKKKSRGERPPLSFLEEASNSPEALGTKLQTGACALSDVDPDRPFVSKMSYVEAFQDISNALVPVLKAAAETKPAKIPSYFGRGVDDEGFADFTNTIGDDPSYRLYPTFDSQFDGKGAEKATGGPQPNMLDAWKPMFAAGTPTAFFKQAEQPAPVVVDRKQSDPDVVKLREERDDLKKRIDDLYARLDEMEMKRSRNSQTEILLFVGTGMGILMALHALSSAR